MERIFNNLQKLRSQPEHVRRHVLYLSVGVAALLMFGLWVVSLGSSVQNISQTKESGTANPLSALKANLIGGYESLKEPSSSAVVQ